MGANHTTLSLCMFINVILPLIKEMHPHSSIVLLRNLAGNEQRYYQQVWSINTYIHYSFVLMSRFVNALEVGGGPYWLVRDERFRNTNSWDHPLGAFFLGILQLALSGWQQNGCIVVENELQCWKKGNSWDRRKWEWYPYLGFESERYTRKSTLAC